MIAPHVAFAAERGKSRSAWMAAPHDSFHIRPLPAAGTSRRPIDVNLMHDVVGFPPRTPRQGAVPPVPQYAVRAHRLECSSKAEIVYFARRLLIPIAAFGIWEARSSCTPIPLHRGRN